MGIGVLLLGFYQGFATAATSILFGNIFGVSGTQLLILVAIGLVMAVMATWYRPLLFASIDPEAAAARGVPIRRLGLMFLVVLALTVTGAAQVVGTLLVLSLAITPAAAAQRLSARPLVVAMLSVVVVAVAARRRRPAGQLRRQQHQGERLHHQHQLRHLHRRAPDRLPTAGPPSALP